MKYQKILSFVFIYTLIYIFDTNKVAHGISKHNRQNLNLKQQNYSLFDLNKYDKDYSILFQKSDRFRGQIAGNFNALPEKYLGKWSGVGTQSEPEPHDWSISIDLTGSEINSVVGTIAYPSLECSGELTLTEITAEYINYLNRKHYIRKSLCG